MKGIYLIAEGKALIEAKIAELEEVKHNCKTDYEWNEAVTEQNTYKQILSSATILPVEESWGSVKLYSHSTPISLSKDYPNGVIIQPKQ